jgi:hypothetical protein
MNITRKFDNNGDCFAKMFNDLVESKVEDFVNKTYMNQTNDRKGC